MESKRECPFSDLLALLQFLHLNATHETRVFPKTSFQTVSPSRANMATMQADTPLTDSPQDAPRRGFRAGGQ